MDRAENSSAEPTFFYDSMYEMDAPKYYDFNATHEQTIDDTIFDRKIVGEKDRLLKAGTAMFAGMEFRSPSSVFRDIANITPRDKQKTPLTKFSAELGAKHQSPILTRSKTRSMTASEIDKTLTPLPSLLLESPRNARKTSTPNNSKPLATENFGTPLNTTSEKNDNNCGEWKTPKLVQSTDHADKSILVADIRKATGAADEIQSCNSEKLPSDSKLSPSKNQSPKVSTKIRCKVQTKRKSSSPNSQRRSVPKSSSHNNVLSKSSTTVKKISPRTRTTLHHSKSLNNGRPITTCARDIITQSTMRRSINSSNNISAKSKVKSGSQSSLTIPVSPPRAIKTRSTASKPPSIPVANVKTNTANNSKGKVITQQYTPNNILKRTVSQDDLLRRLMKPTESSNRMKYHSGSTSTNDTPNKRKASDKPESDSKPAKLRIIAATTPDLLKRKGSTPSLSARKASAEKSHTMNTRAEKSHAMQTRADIKQRAPRDLFKTAAEQVYDFTHRTPQRFRALSKDPTPTKINPSPRSTTIPISPKFHKNLRKRSSTVMSAEQRELQEIEDMKKNQFKAAPLNKRILNGVVGVKEKTVLPLTKPLLVHFTTDDRITKHHEQQAKAEEPAAPRITRSKMHMHSGVKVFKPALEHHCTEVLPFSFEVKDEEVKKKKQQMLKDIEDAEAKLRNFKAKPLPPSPEPLAPRNPQPATVPDPFKLKTVEVGANLREKLRKKVELEEAKFHSLAQVKAKSPEVLRKQPFVPQKSQLPTTDPLDIVLNSTKRAVERQAYDQERLEQKNKAKKREAIARKQWEEEEAAELARLRSERVIRQQPIKQYKPVHIKPSDKSLTRPAGPSFLP